MVETGQEATFDAKLQEKQEEHHCMGDRPLVVIKGQSLKRKWQQLEEDKANHAARVEKGERVSESEKARLMVMANEMRRWEKEDEKLKRKQLKLSKRSKWVELPDIGHHVIRDAPEKVIEEVKWVMDDISDHGVSSNESHEKLGDKQRDQSIPWLKKFGMAMHLNSKDDEIKRRSSR